MARGRGSEGGEMGGLEVVIGSGAGGFWGQTRSFCKCRRVGLRCDLKRLVSNADIQIILMLNAQYEYQSKRGGPMKTQQPT